MILPRRTRRRDGTQFKKSLCALCIFSVSSVLEKTMQREITPRSVGIFLLFLLSLYPEVLCGEILETMRSFRDLKNTIPPPAPIRDFTLYGGEAVLQEGGVLLLKSFPGSKLVYEKRDFETETLSAEVFLRKGQGGNAALIVHVNEPGIGADLFHGMEIGLFADEQRVIFGLHCNHFEQLHSLSAPVPLDRWFRWDLEFDEENYTVFIDGEKIAQFSDPQKRLRPGKIGFRPWNRDMQIRNARIREGSGPFQPIPFEPAEEIVKNWPESLCDFESLPTIALITHFPMSAPPAVGQDFAASDPLDWGCDIRILEPANPEKPVRKIFEDPQGCIYDLNRSFDGKRLYFSHRKKGQRFWNLWKINTDGTELQQLTRGDFHDVAPCEMPGGRIVFVSSRRFGYTVCQPGPASNLFTMNPDGTDIRCVSMNTLSDFSPQILADGRVLFTRWEYVDRDLTYRQSLWTQNPDGTSYRLFFGNTIRDVGTFWQARAIPGATDRVLATFAPHHGFPHGAIGIIDRSQGVEGEKGRGFRYITKEFPVIEDRFLPWAYRDPYPLSEHLYLCSFGSGGTFLYDESNGGNSENKYRIYLLDSQGEKRLLYEDPLRSCFYPIALDPVKVPPVIAPQRSASEPPWDDSKRTQFDPDSHPRGTVYLTDVFRGIEHKIPRERPKSLRILEQIRKTEDIRDRAFDQSPVMGYGTYYAKRHWGEVPLEEDGSAHFIVPALREIYFQLLDEEGRELHRMTSAVQVMPGERTGCIGCHESRDSAPPSNLNRFPSAFSKPPTEPAIPEWFLHRKRPHPEPDAAVFDYPSLVQPVLDRYCIACHHGENASGGYDLTGDKTRYFSMSYDNLLGKSKSYRQHDMLSGKMLPEEAAKEKPLVHFYWLLWTPSAIHEPFQSGTLASRLPQYMEKEHCGKDIPLEDRQKVYFWMDANVPYYATYANSRPLSPGKRDLYTDPQTGRLSPWFTEQFSEVYKRRCTECHSEIQGSTDWEGKYAWINLSRPRFSPALTAHLSKNEKGRGIEPILFQSREEPDYLEMLHAVEKGKLLLDQVPSADQPGFQNPRSEP